MILKIILSVSVVLSTVTVLADVTPVAVAPKIDGRLDEPDWAAAKWESGFRKLGKNGDDRLVKADTAFAILADEENVYIGVRCIEKNMTALKARKPAGIFSSQTDSIEIDLAPDGGTFEYYQFVVTYLGLRHAEFYSEGGFIRPDPFGPEWESAVGEESDAWTLELRLPLAAFYMTRNAKWHTDWRVNVARSNPGEGFSCWCDIYANFREMGKYRVVKGFPVRRAADDVYVKSVVFSPSVRDTDGKIAGELSLEIQSSVAGSALLTTSLSKPVRVDLAQGVKTLRVAGKVAGNGRFPCLVELLREGAETPIKRTYPTIIDYQPIRIALTNPQYRNNFYPGQAADLVKGRVETSSSAPVDLTIKGPGFETRTLKLAAGGGEFSFDTTGFDFGDAMLTVVAGEERQDLRIRRLKPLEKGHMTWIEDGHLVFDGKPVFRRNMYAEYYLGGEAFKRKYDSDDLCQTRDIVRIATLEANRLIPGSERKEAIFDRKPSPEIYAKLDAVIAKGLSSAVGSYYYISDEPECRLVSPVYLKHVYDYVAERDPYHVILCGSRAGRTYGKVADWFETHPYLNPHPDPVSGKRIYGRDFNVLGSFVDAYSPEANPGKCVGCMPTCFQYETGCRPTFREYVTHTWNFLVHGAKSYFSYAYHDLGDAPTLYEGTRFVNQTAERLSDFFLFGERKSLVATPETEGAIWTLKDGRRLIALVNCTDEPRNVTVRGLAGEFVEFRGSRAVVCDPAGTKFGLGPLDVFAATSEKMDDGLSTYDAMWAKVVSLEKDRLSRDNQLLGKQSQVTVSFSGKKARGNRKMFDGTRDFLAWSSAVGTTNFYEIAFTKIRPVFRELRVYGWRLDGLQVCVRKDGDWQTLEPVDIRKDEFSVFLTFPSDILTTKIRLEFPASNVVRELYEIELPRVAGLPADDSVEAAGSVVLGRPACPEQVAWKVIDIVETGRWNKSVKIAPDCKWIVFDLASCQRKVDGRYTSWGLYYGTKSKVKLAGDVTDARLGLYTLPVPSDFDTRESLMLRVYNATVVIPFLAGCAEPADRLSFVESGGQWKIDLHLAAPCEDVTCALYGNDGVRPVPYVVKGSDSVALKPCDANRMHWQTTLAKPLEPKRGRKGNPMQPWAQVEVLGGKLGVPLHTGLSVL